MSVADRIVAGPVAPTTAASGTHQPIIRASLASGLLHQWQQRNLAASLPLALRQLEDAGNLDNVRLAIQADQKNADAEGEATSAADGYGAPGGHRPVGVGPVDPLPGPRYHGPVFIDSDIYKTLRRSGGSSRRGPPRLASFLADGRRPADQAQRPDGYLNSYVQVTASRGTAGWLKPRDVLRRSPDPGRGGRGAGGGDRGWSRWPGGSPIIW